MCKYFILNIFTSKYGKWFNSSDLLGQVLESLLSHTDPSHQPQLPLASGLWKGSKWTRILSGASLVRISGQVDLLVSVLLKCPRREKPTGILLWSHPSDIPEGKTNWVMINEMETFYNKRSLSVCLCQT